MRDLGSKSGKLVTSALFLAAGVLLVVSVATMYWIGRIALDSNRELATQRDMLARLELVNSRLTEAESGQRGYLLTGDESYLALYAKARGSIAEDLGRLSERARGGELAEQPLNRVSLLAQEKLAELAETIELRRQGNSERAIEIVKSHKGRDLMNALRATLSELEKFELRQFEEASRRAQTATRQRNMTFIGTGILNLLFLGWAYRRIWREMGQREEAQAELAESHAELERRVRDRTMALEAANRELEAFGYSVSHDLRAPLRHVSSYIKLLEKNSKDSLSEQSRRYVHTIAEAAQRMGQLIDDLLVLSRIGRATLADTPVDLGELVEDARHALAGELAERDIEWRIGQLPTVRGDVNLLRSAMINLVANAVKYTRRKKPAVIEIGSKPSDSETVCYVRDNGAGFDMKFVDKLFGVFQRLHDRGEFEGTGIGLASVRRIIQRHGGKTWAEGQVDQGATFYFSMPLERIL